MSTKALFSPIKLGNHQLQHRVVLAPLTRLRSGPNGVPSDLQLEYYQQRASEGGLLIAEATYISPLAGGYRFASGIYHADQIDAWKRITRAVHDKGSTVFVQLWHMGRLGSSQFNPQGEQVVAPSAIAVPGKNKMGVAFEAPRALSVDEIQAIIQEYRQAALNAIEAGFDGIELHGANGYLIDQFIHASSNQRTDVYGGSLENRSRFVLEVIAAVANAIGPQKIGIRFSPGGDFPGIQDDSPVDTFSYIVGEIQSRFPGLAYLHLKEPHAEIQGGSLNQVDSLAPYREIWKGPFISANGFSTARDYAIDYAENTGSMIAFGRSFIANPDLPERLKNNWELNAYDRRTFYSHEATGYTDYPFYKNT
jgi:2,4-dienoyl-CoA reductase-like NADH-dependent reductase (Old Yellow Enzyme family)